MFPELIQDSYVRGARFGIRFYLSEGKAIGNKGGGRQIGRGCKGNRGEGMEKIGPPGAAVSEAFNPWCVPTVNPDMDWMEACCGSNDQAQIGHRGPCWALIISIKNIKRTIQA